MAECIKADAGLELISECETIGFVSERRRRSVLCRKDEDAGRDTFNV